MADKKFYVVWRGRIPGIYESWADCAIQVSGFPGAKFKGFKTLFDAQQAFDEGWETYIGKKPADRPLSPAVAANSISVDAACSGSPGKLEYRGVSTKTGEVLFHVGPLQSGTNNLGEFLAIVHALAWLQKQSSKIPVYSDSRNAIRWVKKRQVKSTLPRNNETEAVWQLVDRALNWLTQNNYPNQIIKWETAEWGEIRADFGRK
jgi:ribonuclease HI